MNDLFNKKINDLTVGDSLKIQGYVLGTAAVITALGLGVSVAVESVAKYRWNKKAKQTVNQETEK